MPKIPYKPEKSGGNDDDYEIVSFDDFSDKSPGSKTDLLTLNDNINYRLYYEADKQSKYLENNGESSKGIDSHTETSLNGARNGSFRKLSNSFVPFGKSGGKTHTPLFSGVKSKNENESSSREHRYQRFSENRTFMQRVCDMMPGTGSSVLAIILLCGLSLASYWAVGGTIGGSWGEEHYKKLWERTHPENVKKPLSPMPHDKQVIPEYRYHDHNNLSTKNRSNGTEAKKKEFSKKNVYVERPAAVLRELCALVADNMKFDCYPQGDINEENCVKRGCCWKVTQMKGAPYCYYPSQYDTFRFVNMTEDKHSMTVFYEKARPSGYPDDFELVRMDFKYMSDEILQIKIYDAENNRFEPPYPEISMGSKTLTDMKYRVVLEGSKIGFKVIRNSDDVVIFNTQDVGGLILSDKFLQISAILPTDHVFGLGEKRARFMNNMDWQTFAIFNRDRAPTEGLNLYGTHPFYLAVEQNGQSHGTLLLNSNAMDIVLQPSPGITYRATGGVLQLFVLAGPSPALVARQYTELVGRPFMPPYWSLGFHLCKFNYGNLSVMADVWQRNRDAGIPFDVQWNDIDYMTHSNDFTLDAARYAGLPAFVKRLHSEGMHYVMIFDIGIGASEKPGTYKAYDRGIEMDIFVKNSSNQPFIGRVWNKGSTVYPDFTHPNSTPYWVEMMTDFHKLVPYDGAWIDMNEPSNFEDGPLHGACAPEQLPYRPRTGDPQLHTHTLCMDAAHHAGPHRHYHDLVGLMHAVATNFALQEIRGKRPFIISRASFVGLGRYAGHWSGDISSQWHDMKMSIPELLSFSLFGVPMMGADICGFNGDTNVELCTRWMQLGAFYPFSRNHNTDTAIPQDPASLGPAVVQASRAALRTRYKLLPYYYTLFWRAHVLGDTVVRPLLFEFPEMSELHDIDTQFMVGPHVMVAPVLEPGTDRARALFPGAQGWYSLATGRHIATNDWAEVLHNDTVSIKGGGVVVLQEPAARGPVSTGSARSAPLQLLAAPDAAAAASGRLYWDDGDSLHTYEEKKYSYIEFSLNGTEIQSHVKWWGYGVPLFNQLSILNQPPVKQVLINGMPCVSPCSFTYYKKNKVLSIMINLSLEKPFNVRWSYDEKYLNRTGASRKN